MREGRELTNRQMMFALTEEIFSRNFNENASRQLLFRQVIDLSSHQDKKSASPTQGLAKLKPDFGSPSSHTYLCWLICHQMGHKADNGISSIALTQLWVYRQIKKDQPPTWRQLRSRFEKSRLLYWRLNVASSNRQRGIFTTGAPLSKDRFTNIWFARPRCNGTGSAKPL